MDDTASETVYRDQNQKSKAKRLRRPATAQRTGHTKGSNAGNLSFLPTVTEPGEFKLSQLAAPAFSENSVYTALDEIVKRPVSVQSKQTIKANLEMRRHIDLFHNV